MNDYNIKQLYEEMELHLISSMQRNFKRHLNEEKEVGFNFSQWQVEKLKELKRYQKENKDIITDSTKGLNKSIANRLKEELKQGAMSAINLHNRFSEEKVKADKLLNKSFFKTNDRKINSLIKSINNDLKTANKGTLRMINDQYRQVIHKSAFFVANGAMTEKQAIDMANKDFLSRGLNCIEYKNGRRVNIASYAEMAIRTASVRAQLMGEGDFRKSIGRTLVQATSHGGACPICQKWENHIFIDDVYSGGTKKDGNYMLLSEAMKQGFLHPNCEHGLITYYPELDWIYEELGLEEEQDLQDKINYIDRNIKKYKRLEKGSLDERNISEARNSKNKFKIIKENLIDMINDYKVPITINDFPNIHKEAIINIISNSPKSIRKVINDNITNFRFKNIKTVKKERFSSSTNDIKINLEKDEGYKNLFHEISHNIDYILGRPSQDRIFKKLIIEDFNRAKTAYMVKYNLSEEDFFFYLEKKLSSSDAYNPVSDIVSGITENKCHGRVFHRASYWEKEHALEREAFANFGSAFIRKDREEVDYLTQMFPNAVEHFKNYFKR